MEANPTNPAPAPDPAPQATVTLTITVPAGRTPADVAERVVSAVAGIGAGVQRWSVDD